MVVKELNKPVTLPVKFLRELDAREYYHDKYPIKEDKMSASHGHRILIVYLISVLEWLFYKERWFVAGELNIYQTEDEKEKPISPDAMVFKGLTISPEDALYITSWKMVLPNRPAPTVCFEISSKNTRGNDLRKKPRIYYNMGVKEYFAYDPRRRPSWRKAPRLQGWRFLPDGMEKITPNEQGWLWSEELDSWLVPDEAFLRLYDKEGYRRLSELEYYRFRDEDAHARMVQAEAKMIQAEAEARQARLDVEKFKALLRQQGINPDNL